MGYSRLENYKRSFKSSGSVHYILDGYNILKKIPYLSNRHLSQGRQGFLDLIKRFNLCGKNKVTVVFDGRSDVVAPPHRTDFIVLFSEDETADDLIKKVVKKSKNPRQVIVVSDDRELRFEVKRLSARVISVEEFTKKIPAKKSREKFKDKAFLKKDDAQRITEELKRIWLKEI